jgi:hypothetical protein
MMVVSVLLLPTLKKHGILKSWDRVKEKLELFGRLSVFPTMR